MTKAPIRSVALLLAMLASPLAATPAAITTDQRPDAAQPAAMDAVRIPSGDAAMNAIVYTPGGPGPYPALILFHGFPGNEQNLDLAQAARRAGFVVLTLHYRGSWGSPGNFSLAGVVEDGSAALAWLEAPAALARYHSDPRRIVLAGHSMGGFVASRTAAAHPETRGLLLIDAWNIGAATLKSLQAPGGREQFRTARAGDVLPLAGTGTDALADEILAAGERFDLKRDAARLADRPFFAIGAARANGREMGAIAGAVRAAGGKQVTSLILPSDHGFNDHRIALIAASLDWLEQFKAQR